jgi:chromosome segregation ATPase
MGRTPLNTEESVRATVLTMLAEHGHVPPLSTVLFRSIVSVRKLRARLKGGDLTTLGRLLNTIEEEVTQQTANSHALPDLPETVSNLMLALWRAAIDAQTVEIERIKEEAAQTVAGTEDRLNEANARVELLLVAVADLRKELAARDQTIGGQDAKLEESARINENIRKEHDQLSTRLAQAQQALADVRRNSEEKITTTHEKYAGLSQQLLTQTDAQRQTWAEEKKGLVQQLREAKERIAELRAERQHLLDGRSNRRTTSQDGVP